MIRDHQPNELVPNAARRVWVRSLAAGALVTLLLIVPARLLAGPVSNGASHETIDTLTWGMLLGVAVAGLILAFSNSWPDFLVRRDAGKVTLAFIAVVESAAIAWVEPLPGLDGQLWFGFGTHVLLATAFAIPILYVVVRGGNEALLRFMFGASLVLACVVYLPSILQPHWGIMDSLTSGYVINEVLGPAQGHFALGDQVAQYSSLVGLPLAPVIAVVGHPLALALGYLSALAVLTVVGLIAIAWLVLPYRLRFLSVLLVVPLVLVKVQPPTTPQGSLAVSLSALPCRLAPLVGMGLLLIHATRRTTLRSLAAVGLLGGLAAVNNLEFGMPVLIASGVVLSLRSSSRRPGVGSLVFLVAAALPAVAYSILLSAVGQAPQWSAWWAFVAAFGSGFGAVAMPPIGPHIIVTMTLVAGAVTGAYQLCNLARRKAVRDVPAERRLLAASTTAAFFGLAGLGSFGYFAGRSVVSIQLQVFLVYVVPIISAQFTLVALPDLRRRSSLAPVGMAAVLLIPAGLAAASLLQAPDPSYEWRRVLSGIGSDSAASPYDAAAATTAAEVARFQQATGTRVASAALPFGNISQSLTGLANYSALDWPLDRSISRQLLAAYCSRLRKAPSPLYVRDFTNPDGSPACSGYVVLARMPSGAQVIRHSADDG